MRERVFLIACTALVCGSVHAQDGINGCSSANPDIRIAACTALIQSGPGATADSAVVFNNRGIGYAAKGAYDQAIQDYDEAVSVNPSFALAYSNRGVAYEAKGLFERAIQDYSKAIAMAPDLRAAFNNRCYALAELGHADQAIADCDRAVMLEADDARALDSRGYVYYRLGRYADAIRDLDRALKLSSTMPTALYVRGAAKLKLGDPSGSTDLQIARSLDRDVAGSMARVGVSPALTADSAPSP